MERGLLYHNNHAFSAPPLLRVKPVASLHPSPPPRIFESMPTYTYATLDGSRRFDVRQSFSDAPLERDPETGEPVRRVISGGAGPLTAKESAKIGQPAVGGGGCGSNCACGH